MRFLRWWKRREKKFKPQVEHGSSEKNVSDLFTALLLRQKTVIARVAVEPK
jgi:hypothetical protein